MSNRYGIALDSAFRAILSGERDPAVLALLRDTRCRQ
jgi:hypothetical protein